MHEGYIQVIDKKLRTEVTTSLDNFEKQIMQFTNAARTINDKFKTTVDRVSKLENQFKEFFDNSASLKKLADDDD